MYSNSNPFLFPADQEIPPGNYQPTKEPVSGVTNNDALQKDGENKDTIPEPLIAILASCGALVLILCCFAAYCTYHRRSYRKNQVMLNSKHNGESLTLLDLGLTFDTFIYEWCMFWLIRVKVESYVKNSKVLRSLTSQYVTLLSPRQQHLTEELQTVENGYHDNPTLEVMEVQPEMQEKKLTLNREFNDSWIVPIDNLLKEDIIDEEDTHL